MFEHSSTDSPRSGKPFDPVLCDVICRHLSVVVAVVEAIIGDGADDERTLRLKSALRRLVAADCRNNQVDALLQEYDEAAVELLRDDRVSIRGHADPAKLSHNLSVVVAVVEAIRGDGRNDTRTLDLLSDLLRLTAKNCRNEQIDALLHEDENETMKMLRRARYTIRMCTTPDTEARAARRFARYVRKNRGGQ